jgi:ABC-type oligopeptide transport system ATPase subunit
MTTPTPKDNELTLQSFKTPLRYVIVGAYKFVNVEDVHKLLANEVDQYTQSKLKAFARELEAKAEHMNNGELDDAHWYGMAIPVEALKAIKGKAGIE